MTIGESSAPLGKSHAPPSPGLPKALNPGGRVEVALGGEAKSEAITEHGRAGSPAIASASMSLSKSNAIAPFNEVSTILSYS